MFSRAGQEKKCSTDRSSSLQYALEGGVRRPKYRNERVRRVWPILRRARMTSSCLEVRLEEDQGTGVFLMVRSLLKGREDQRSCQEGLSRER